MNSKIVFLTNSFYQDHPNPPFKEMEQKQNRPYIVFLVEIEGHTWAYLFARIFAIGTHSLPMPKINAELIIRKPLL